MRLPLLPLLATALQDASALPLSGAHAAPPLLARAPRPSMKASATTLADEQRELFSEEIFDENGVICARGVCVLAEPSAPEMCYIDDNDNIDCIRNPDAAEVKPIWPSLLLLGCSVLYGTNFALGRLMNDALPASASTSARMLIAALALSPFLLQLKPNLRSRALLCGCFTALGYISQSISLVDTPAATVAFLGALTVVICPLLGGIFDGRQLGFKDAPITWIAATLCLGGVGVLELGGGGLGEVGWGDFWAVLQAVGFGTSFYITEKLMAREPSQALPITAAQCAVAAALSGTWAIADGVGVISGSGSAWLLDDVTRGTFTLPGLLLEPTLRPVAAAALWTGLVTTAGNRFGETTALGRLSSSEASVLLATEPMWAALFAAGLIGESLGSSDAAGGILIVAACAVNGADEAWARKILRIDASSTTEVSLSEQGGEVDVE